MDDPTSNQSTDEVRQQITPRVVRWLRSRHAPAALAIISFAESAFAPIIIDPFLMATILANPRRWRRDTTIAIIASIIGGTAAYWVGALFYNTWGKAIISFYGLETLFAHTATQIGQNAFVFVLIGAVTPVPYKLVALAGGLLHINFLTFMVASVIGRVFRLGLVGSITHSVGPRALPVVRQNLHRIALFVAVVLMLYLAWQFFH